MTGNKTTMKTKPLTVVATDPDDLKGTLKNIGGSQSDHWNNTLANQVVQALWVKNSRTSEVIGAKWSEIDLDAGCAAILPAEAAALLSRDSRSAPHRIIGRVSSRR